MIPPVSQLRIALLSIALIVLNGCSALEFSADNQQAQPQLATTPAQPQLASTPAQAPAPVAAKPAAATTRLPASKAEPETVPQDPVCRQFFSTSGQKAAREACTFGRGKFESKSAAMDKCRAQYAEQTRLALSCFVGAGLTSQTSASAEDDMKFKLCKAEYPISSDLDIYLQEACFVGISLPALTGKPPKLELCRDVASERAFFGPCGVGLSLAANLSRPQTADVAEEATDKSKVDSNSVNTEPKPETSADKSSATSPSRPETNEQNQMCERYFNKTVFHSGYRACLNSRTLSLNWTGKYKDILKTCDDIISDPKNDTERASCIIGVSIWHHLSETVNSAPTKVISRFAQCGEGSKVTYQDKGYLACLTAASLLDFLSKPAAGHACKDVFNSKKSKVRSECQGALGKFHNAEEAS